MGKKEGEEEKSRRMRIVRHGTTDDSVLCLHFFIIWGAALKFELRTNSRRNTTVADERPNTLSKGAICLKCRCCGAGDCRPDFHGNTTCVGVIKRLHTSFG